MPREPLDIPFPLKGLHEGVAYASQPELTTPSCMNVRGRDPINDRLRGAKRNCLDYYNTAQVNGSNAITAGVVVTKIDSRVTYTEVTSMSSTYVAAQVAPPSRLDVIGGAVDAQGNLFAACARSGGGSGLNVLAKYNSSLQLQWLFPLPMQRYTDVLKSVRVVEEDDGRLGIYCVITGSVSGPTRIYKLVEEEFPGPCRIEWYLDAPNGGWWTDVSVKNNVMYAIELTTTPSTILHRYDDLSSVQPTATWQAIIRTGAGADEAYAVAHADDGAAIVALVDNASPPAANGFLEKFGPMQPDTTTPAGANDPGSLDRWQYNNAGVGQAVVVKGGFIYSQGYTATTVMVRRLVDNGDTVSSSATVDVAAVTTFKGAQTLDVDDDGNVYVATFNTGTDTSVTKISAAFSVVWQLTGAHMGASGLEAFTVLVHPIPADQGGGDEQAEYIYVGTEAESGNSYKSISKVQLCTAAYAADGSPRTTFNYCVANGAFKHVTDTAVNTVAGSQTVNTTARWITMAAGLNVVLVTDGLNYFKIDPLTGTYGTASAWTATYGEIPRRARGLSIWAGAAVLYDFEYNPNQWALSAVGDFDDWNFFPVNPSNADAVLGSDSRAGLCPDIITNFIPYSDDLALFGGDHTIQRMTGHPLEGGRFDLVSDITGMARGPCWCKAPDGSIFFIGSRGGLYRITPGSLPMEVTVEPLSDRFRDLDLENNKIMLAWNDKEKGVHVFITPYTAGTTTHFFWSVRENAWWPDRFPYTDYDPLSVWLFDGDDPNDRKILLGCRDGYVCYFSERKSHDRDIYTDSWVYIPVMAGQHAELRLSNFRVVLGNGSGPVKLTAYPLEQPDFNLINPDPFNPVANVTNQIDNDNAGATLVAGRNCNIRDRVRANDVVLRLRSSEGGARWTVETVACDNEMAGRARCRSVLYIEPMGGDNFGPDEETPDEIVTQEPLGIEGGSTPGGGGGGGGINPDGYDLGNTNHVNPEFVDNVAQL